MRMLLQALSTTRALTLNLFCLFACAGNVVRDQPEDKAITTFDAPHRNRMGSWGTLLR